MLYVCFEHRLNDEDSVTVHAQADDIDDYGPQNMELTIDDGQVNECPELDVDTMSEIEDLARMHLYNKKNYSELDFN